MQGSWDAMRDGFVCAHAFGLLAKPDACSTYAAHEMMQPARASYQRRASHMQGYQVAAGLNREQLTHDSGIRAGVWERPGELGREILQQAPYANAVR